MNNILALCQDIHEIQEHVAGLEAKLKALDTETARIRNIRNTQIINLRNTFKGSDLSDIET